MAAVRSLEPANDREVVDSGRIGVRVSVDTSASRRVNFGHRFKPAPVHIYERHNSPTAESTPPRLLLNELQQKIFGDQHLPRGMRHCSKRQTGRCKKPMCPWCSWREAGRTRRALRVKTQQYSRVIEVTLSVASSHNLQEALEALRTMIAALFDHSWVLRRVEGWFRQIEVVHGSVSGWHPHVSILLVVAADVSRSAIRALKRDLIVRWLRNAEGYGFKASDAAVSFTLHEGRDEVRKRILYVTKGLVRQHRPPVPGAGRSLGDLLALAYQDNDKEALSLVHEFAALPPRIRWHEAGGTLSNRSRSGR